MKTVLFLTHNLGFFAGSEINIYELSLTFERMGYRIEIGTFLYKNPIKSIFEKTNINVKNLLYDTLDLDYYDLIWAQHSPILNQVLFQTNIKYKYLIFSSLSPYEPLEVPPVYLKNYVSIFLANSMETKEKMIEEGIPSKKITILNNSVLDDFFQKYKIKKANTTFRSVAIVSNHIPPELYELKKILLQNNKKCTIYGIGCEERLITPNLLLKYDVVITIGKTVQYAMAIGIPVFIYDRFGGDGWVTIENVDVLEKFNFSGRYTKTKLLSYEIYDELMNGYSNVLKNTAKLHKVAGDRYSLNKNVSKIISILSQTSQTNHINKNIFRYMPRTLHIYIRLLKNYYNVNQQLYDKDQQLQDINKQLREKEQQLQEQEQQLQEQEQQLQEKEQHIQNLSKNISQLEELAESMRIKNRIKKVLGIKK